MKFANGEFVINKEIASYLAKTLGRMGGLLSQNKFGTGVGSQ
jgi:hypothetical protein